MRGMTILQGTSVGRDEIRSLHGAGGMGEVCLAYDKSVKACLMPRDELWFELTLANTGDFNRDRTLFSLERFRTFSVRCV